MQLTATISQKVWSQAFNHNMRRL